MTKEANLHRLQTLLATLRARPTEIVARDSAAVCKHIKECPHFQNAKSVCVFLSLSHEVQTQVDRGQVHVCVM